MKRSILQITCFVALLLAGKICFAANAEDMFFEANKLYSNGEYTKAGEQYESLLKSGVESGQLHYNLGNAYFKLGQKGKALASYERAKKLIPADEDLFANINFVTTLLEEAQPQEKTAWFQKLFSGIRDALPPRGWLFMMAVFYYALAVTLAIAIFRPSFRKASTFIASITGFIILSAALFLYGSESSAHHSRRGVIVVPEAEVRYSPSYSGAVAFKLHEGIQAQIIRLEDEWAQIRLTKDKNGWIETASIEEI